MEDELFFKSYSRLLLRDLNDLNDCLNKEDYEKAKQLLTQLIIDTERGIDD